MLAPFAPFEIIIFDQCHGTFIRYFFPVHNYLNPVLHVGNNPDLENVGDPFDIEMSSQAMIDHIVPPEALQKSGLKVCDELLLAVGEPLQDGRSVMYCV